MLRIYALLISIAFAVSAVMANAQEAGTNEAAIALNDKLVSITDSLYARGQQWGQAFKTAYEMNDFSTLMPYRQGLESFIENNTREVTTMKDVSGSGPLRAAMLDFLKLEKEMIATFKIFEGFDANTKDDDIAAAVQKLTDYSKQESDALGKINIEQEAYAQKNGFTVEAPTEEEAEKK